MVGGAILGSGAAIFLFFRVVFWLIPPGTGTLGHLGFLLLLGVVWVLLSGIVWGRFLQGWRELWAPAVYMLCAVAFWYWVAEDVVRSGRWVWPKPDLATLAFAAAMGIPVAGVAAIVMAQRGKLRSARPSPPEGPA